MRFATLLVAAALSGCGSARVPPYESNPADTPVYVPEVSQEEIERQSEIDRARLTDSSLNWVAVGISTGKFSESISSDAYKTYDECLLSFHGEAKTCFPINALPASYWTENPK